SNPSSNTHLSTVRHVSLSTLPLRQPPRPTLCPYTTLFRSCILRRCTRRGRRSASRPASGTCRRRSICTRRLHRPCAPCPCPLIGPTSSSLVPCYAPFSHRERAWPRAVPRYPGGLRRRARATAAEDPGRSVGTADGPGRSQCAPGCSEHPGATAVPRDRSAGDLGPHVLAGLEHLVDQPVLERGARSQDLVALDVLADLLLVTAGVEGESLLEPFAHAQDLVGLDLDVRGLTAALAPHGRLVDEDAGVGQRQALAGRPGGQQHGGGRGRLAQAHRGDL